MRMGQGSKKLPYKGFTELLPRGYPPSLPFIFLLTISLFIPITSEKCPLRCQCLWRNSKITADCTNLELDTIPEDIEVSTQVLNISGNEIPSLIKDQFSRQGLTNLQRVAATGCGLTSIHGQAFSGLTNLVELELADNFLAEVPSKALSEVPGLMSLILRNNPFRAIRSDSFSALSQLSKLDLSHCQIETIETGSFTELRDLQRLYLHANRISEMDPPLTLPTSLHGITLHDNRWQCDCRLRSFRHWLTKNQYVPRPVEPACISPRRLLGLRIQSLSLTEFACKPQLSPTSMFLTVPYGKNISILCKVVADPRSSVSWYFNGDKLFHNEMEASIGDAKRRVVLQKGKPSSRSELLIFNTDAGDNGTYFCKARNKAGESTSNFTLKVANPLVASPRILKLPLEYFVGVAIAIIVILILVLTTVGILLLRICRQKLESRSSRNGGSEGIIVSSATTDLKKMNESNRIGGIILRKNGSTNKIGPHGSTSKMPRYIQMGTGFSVNGSSSCSTVQQQQQQPDLLKPGHASNKSLSESSSQGSYRLAMENIIDEYRQSSEEQNSSSSPTSVISPSHQLIRGSQARGSSGFGSSLFCGNIPSSRRGISSCISSRDEPGRHFVRHHEPISLPPDFGLPTPPPSSLGFQELTPYSLMYMSASSSSRCSGPMRPDEFYPEANYAPRSTAVLHSSLKSPEESRGSPDGSKESRKVIELSEEDSVSFPLTIKSSSTEETSANEELIRETHLRSLNAPESDIIESIRSEQS